MKLLIDDGKAQAIANGMPITTLACAKTYVDRLLTDRYT